MWAIVDGAPTLHEAFEGLVYMLAAKTADAEVLEPHTLTKAKQRPDWPLWEKAIKEELTTLKVARTWRLEEAPLGANIISSKWVFKDKKDATGNIVHYKVRLGVQGFSQISSIDYDNTYAPVAHLTLSCTIIMIANWLGLELHQVDIKGVYLNHILHKDEVLYMQHPPGCKAQGISCLMLHLLKTLYGLKQSGHHWYQKLSSIFLFLGFKLCLVNQAVFYKVDQDQKTLTVVAVHVDDCTITASSKKLIKELISSLHKSLKVTDLSKLHWMLSIKIQHDHASHTIHLSQHTYIDSILHHYNLSDLKLLSTPMNTSIQLLTKLTPSSAAEHVVMHNMPYCEAVGALNWATLTTHLDIMFAVTTVARFTANPSPAHWKAIKWIYHYLAGMCNLWLSYRETKQTLKGYTDMDGSMAEDRHTITGYAFLIDGGTISWSSKWQEIVSLSTTESEYITATHGMKEVLWLCSLLSEVFGTITMPTTLFLDNQAAIALMCDHQYHSHMKHIDMQYHFI